MENLIQGKKWNVKALLILNHILMMILAAVAFMWLLPGPLGSFNPREAGFYISIILAVTFEGQTYFMLRSTSKKESLKIFLIGIGSMIVLIFVLRMIFLFLE